MQKMAMVLAAMTSLNALAWSASTAWQWNDSARPGVYDNAQSASGGNAEAFGPRINLVRSGDSTGFDILEARGCGSVQLTDLVFIKGGLMLIVM